MSTSYILAPQRLTGTPDRLRRVLVTGAHGRIGASFASAVRDRYRLRLLVHREEHLTDAERNGEGFVGDLCEPAPVQSAFEDIDRVIHETVPPRMPILTGGQFSPRRRACAVPLRETQAIRRHSPCMARWRPTPSASTVGTSRQVSAAIPDRDARE